MKENSQREILASTNAGDRIGFEAARQRYMYLASHETLLPTMVSGCEMFLNESWP